MRAAMASAALRLIDIGANLSDPVFQGIYRSKQIHPNDFSAVLKRGFDVGIQKIIITGGSLADSQEAVQISSCDDRLFCTVGCHPTRSLAFEQTEGLTPERYLEQLLKVIRENRSKVAAVGECGLDYDRLKFCPKEVQRKYFERQFDLVDSTGLPLFLHCRNAFEDFTEILRRNRDKVKGGVVHSFDGSVDNAKHYVDFGLYIGINGCSLKTQSNLDVLKHIPIERLLIETDCPWCEIRPTHASYKHVLTHFPSKKKERWEDGIGVKSRNEPRNLLQVLEVIAAVKEVNVIEAADQIYKNTCHLFRWEP